MHEQVRQQDLGAPINQHYGCLPVGGESKAMSFGGRSVSNHQAITEDPVGMRTRALNEKIKEKQSSL